jgi:hypothetical protein
MNILCIESFAHKKHTTDCCSLVLKSSSYWTSLWTFMCVFYLNCHESGLCCYLVIHIENLLCPFFYFWPI